MILPGYDDREQDLWQGTYVKSMTIEDRTRSKDSTYAWVYLCFLPGSRDAVTDFWIIVDE